MTHIWQAARDHFTRWAGGRPTRSVAVVAAVVAEPVPVAEPRAPAGVPSVAVVPLVNLSDEADQDYFADGIAGDIITQLSRSNALFVVPPRRSFTFRGQKIDVLQILRELGAGYVLGGSVRRDGEQVRINAKLVDSATGKQVWAKRFDRAITDLFEVQDAIADGVALAIAPDISAAERQRIASRPIVSLGVVVGATVSGHSIG